MSSDPISIPPTTTLIPVNVSSSWQTYMLPAVSTNVGRLLIFKDIYGCAINTSTLRLSTTGLDTFGFTNTSNCGLSTTYGAWTFMNDGILHWYLTNSYLGSFRVTAWTPNRIAGCQMWLDAADASTMRLASSNVIVQWADKSTVGTNHAIAGAGPTYTPSNVVFNGSNWLNTPLLSSASKTATYFVVFKHTAGSGFAALLATRGGAPLNTLVLIDDARLSAASLVEVSDWSVALSTAPYAFENRYTVVAVVLTPSQITTFINGNCVALASSSSLTGTPSPYEIGAGYTDNRYPFTGTINEIIVYDTSLSESDRITVENYLIQKWNAPRVSFPPVSDGLVYYLDADYKLSYPGTGTTWTDLMGTGKNVTLCNSPTFVIDTNGAYFTFDPSSSQYGTCSSNLQYMSNFSIEACLFYTGVAGSDDAGHVGRNAVLYGDKYPGTTGAVNATLFMDMDPPQMGVGFYISNAPQWQHNNGSPLTSNAWQHIVGTYDTSALRYYVNGVPISSSNETSTPGCNEGGFNIMKRWDYDVFLGGRLALLRIYNRALSAIEVKSNYNASAPRFGLLPNGLVYYLDAGNPASYTGAGSPTWTDLMGTGKNITLVGNPAYSSNDGGYLTFNPATPDYGTYTDSCLPYMNNFTVEAWLYYTGKNGQYASLYADRLDDPSGNRNTNASLRMGEGDDISIGFFTANLYPGWHGTAGCNLTSNTWQHIVGTYDRHKFRLYFNGTQITSADDTTAPSCNTSGFEIMKRSEYGSLGGRLGLLRIYNRALSAAEVLCNYVTSANSRFHYPYVSSNLLYHFDAGRADSYPGYGTNWSDIQSGQTLAFQGSPYYSNINGGCIVFNGNWAKTAATISLQWYPDGFSIEVWIYYTGVTGSAGNPNAYNAAIFTTHASYGNIPTALGAINSYPPSTSVGFNSSLSWYQSPATEFAMPLNTWCHIVGTYDNTLLNMYSNSVLRTSITQTISEAPARYNDTFQVMKRWDADDFINGYLALVRVYDRGLTSNEVAFNYNASRSRFGL